MKKIIFAIVIISLVTTISCNKDKEEDIPNPIVSDDAVTFGSTDASITAAAFLDLGDYDALMSSFSDEEETLFESASHFGSLFILCDGTFDSLTSRFINAEINIRTELFSSGGGTFRRGSFQYIDPIELEGQPNVAVGQNYFTDLVVDYQGEQSKVTAGTVAIAGTSPDWTISFDITLGVSTTLKGAYSGGMIKLSSE